MSESDAVRSVQTYGICANALLVGAKIVNGKALKSSELGRPAAFLASSTSSSKTAIAIEDGSSSPPPSSRADREDFS